MNTLKIATRQSPMALIQTEKVAHKLQGLYPELNIELVKMTSKGDQILDRSLADLGGKGLFIKTLEEALLQGKADFAVHSLKDVPPTLEPEFVLTAVFPRLSPYDVLVSNKGSLDQLPKGAIVGTSSVRRAAQLLRYRPDLQAAPVRGNVNSRLSKLDAGQYDALILGQAGLMHLGFTERITEVLPLEVFLPSVGQGTIAMETLQNRQDIIELLSAINDPDTFACISAERSMNTYLGANCTSPVGSFAKIENNTLILQGAVYSQDGKTKLSTIQKGKIQDALHIGKKAADDLLAQGAKSIL